VTLILGKPPPTSFEVILDPIKIASTPPQIMNKKKLAPVISSLFFIYGVGAAISGYVKSVMYTFSGFDESYSHDEKVRTSLRNRFKCAK
jgi:hypothetical protein